MMLSERGSERRKWKLYHLSAFMNFHFALFYGITRCLMRFVLETNMNLEIFKIFELEMPKCEKCESK